MPQIEETDEEGTTMQPGEDDSAMANFLGRVQQLSGLDSRTEAEGATRATLRALAEAITGGQMDELCTGLPVGLRPEVEQARGQARSFDRGAFLDRITGEIETVDLDKADRRARAVLTALYEWAPEGEIDDTIAQLPAKLSQMFR